MKRHATMISVDQVKEKILPILQRHGARRAGIFGSLARGELRANSDIDVLVELEKDLSLLDVIGIQQELEDVLGRKVDLVEYDAIKPVIKSSILAEEVPIL